MAVNVQRIGEYMAVKRSPRTIEQFELERTLRQKILASSREKRGKIVGQAYRQLFDKFPEHPRLSKTKEEAARDGRMKAHLLIPLLRRESDVLEIGCGTGDVIEALSEQGYVCTGVEISEEMLKLCKERHLNVILGSADHVDCPSNSFDVVFSQEVIEHLHPDDVPRHFIEAFRLLRPNGILAVETPNRRTGPQDVSRGFTHIAEGLHLKEWTVGELTGLFMGAGFVEIRGLLVPQFLARRSAMIHRLTRVPAGFKYLQDLVLILVPTLRLRTIVGKSLGLDDIFLFGKKPTNDPNRKHHSCTVDS